MAADERSSLWILALTAGALAVGALLYFTAGATPADIAWAAAALLPLGRLGRDIVADLRRRRPGVDVIALLAVAAALVLGEFLTAAIVGVMLATGQYLEWFAAGRAERELTSLLQRVPRLAHLVAEDGVDSIDVAEVRPDDRLLVKAGEVVPVDGVVLAAVAVLDESALTGEALPVERPRGDMISSGTVNAASSFEMQAVATAERSTYAGIIRLVEEASRSRPPSVRLADMWAGWFVPLTLSVAGVAWAVSGDPVRALAVLVVATPCPLLLAVPIAIVSGISRGAQRGIIFRGGASLEALAATTNVVMDKTGTLTVGEPRLRSVATFGPGLGETEVLRLAASVDQASTHVLARAIVVAARDRGLPLVLPGDVTEVPGGGVTGTVDGHRVAVGSDTWLLEVTAETSSVAEFRRRRSRVAPMSVFVSVDGEIVAAFTFDDAVRPDAATTVRALRRAGVQRIVMATGDHPVVAQSVGAAIGFDEILAECTPQEKVEALTELRKQGVTAMVGDGINDAPALAAADVGIALGARGATASSEASDVVLMVDRLQRLVDAIGIAQRSRRIALESVVLGMGLSLIAMGAASFGFLPPIAGAIIQEAIDVIAMGNASRALGGRAPTQPERRLTPELSEWLRREHDRLIPELSVLQETADRLDAVSASEAMTMLTAIRDFLVMEIRPHELDDERVIYPEVATLLGGDDPLATMSRAHREIFHLIDVYQRILDDLSPTGPEAGDVRDLRRLLYGLHAILRLHFDQEEELYASLDEDYPIAGPATPDPHRVAAT